MNMTLATNGYFVAVFNNVTNCARTFEEGPYFYKQAGHFYEAMVSSLHPSGSATV